MASHSRRRGTSNTNRAGNKTGHDQKENENVDESSPVIIAFREFQKELDNRNDKHERLVKLSRDITIESKRLIFLLHRVNGMDDRSPLLKEAAAKLEEIHQVKFLPLAKELQGQDPYQYLRAFTAGLQEYVEAVTFYHYVAGEELVSVDKVQADIIFKSDSGTSMQPSETQESSTHEPLQVPVPFTEYMLGIADFTGELMRLSINSVGSGDLETPKKVASLMRDIYNAFVSFSNTPRELRRKTTVLRQSLRKVENACYNLRVRGSEIPKHMLADVFSSISSSVPEESFNTNEPDEIM